MTERRHVKLFRNGRNQAVRIPVEFELPGDEAIMHRDGDRLVIEPVRKRGLVALLKSMKPIEESFPEIDDPDESSSSPPPATPPQPARPTAVPPTRARSAGPG
jgi:antitoxin VapB